MSVAHSVISASSKHSVAHFSDQALLCDLVACMGQKDSKKAEVLACLAEVESRELYLPAGYPSMLAYCMGALRMSRDAALKRLRAARAAREFPAIYDAVAEGRLALSVVAVLKPHLNEENVDELLAATAGRSKSEVEQLLAQRVPLLDSCPQQDVMEPAEGSVAAESVAPGPLGVIVPTPEPPVACAPPTAVAPARIPLRFTVDPETYDLLQRAQDLLSHQVPPT